MDSPILTPSGSAGMKSDQSFKVLLGAPRGPPAGCAPGLKMLLYPVPVDRFHLRSPTFPCYKVPGTSQKSLASAKCGARLSHPPAAEDPSINLKESLWKSLPPKTSGKSQRPAPQASPGTPPAMVGEVTAFPIILAKLI